MREQRTPKKKLKLFSLSKKNTILISDKKIVITSIKIYVALNAL